MLRQAQHERGFFNPYLPFKMQDPVIPSRFKIILNRLENVLTFSPDGRSGQGCRDLGSSVATDLEPVAGLTIGMSST